MADHAVLPPPTVAVPRRPSTASLVVGQFRYCNRSFWRTPVAAFFTLVFPLSFLVVVCAIAGNAVMDQRSGVRVAQFLTPVFAVFGACMAAFVSLAIGVAYAREAGVLKRLRSTPLPPWVHLAGRVAAAVWVSVIAITLVTVVGVVFYGVEIVWRTVPAVIVTLVVGVACFAALGLAVVSLAPSAGAAQAIANGGLIVLAFVSDVFVITLPQWLDSVGWWFPLKHFVNAVADAFNPAIPGTGFAWGHLGVLLAWGVAGTLVALRFFTWEPHVERAGRRRRPREVGKGAEPTHRPVASMSVRRRGLSASTVVGPRPWWALAYAQGRYTTVKLLRDPLAVFFSIVFPVLLLVLFAGVYGRDATWGGLPLAQYLAAVFSVYGVAVMAYVNLSSVVAEDRAHLVLKRLRGTPLPPGAYLAGRIGATVVLGLVTVVLVFGVGALVFGVRVGLGAALSTAVVLLPVVACLAALGLLLASLLESPQSVTAVALATLLPLSMVSDIFINSPDLPAVMSGIGWTFPLRHMSWVAVAASSGQPWDAAMWGHLAVIALWGVVATVLAARLFRWEPRR